MKILRWYCKILANFMNCSPFYEAIKFEWETKIVTIFQTWRYVIELTLILQLDAVLWCNQITNRNWKGDNIWDLKICNGICFNSLVVDPFSSSISDLSHMTIIKYMRENLLLFIGKFWKQLYYPNTLNNFFSTSSHALYFMLKN